MKNRILFKLLGIYVALILMSTIVLDFFVGVNLKHYYESKITEKLENNAYLLSILLRETGGNKRAYIDRDMIREISEDIGSRITVVDLKGNVLVDSEEDIGSMENHNDRPEIKDAFTKGIGQSTRFSETLGYNMKYVAAAFKISGQTAGVVRLSLPLRDIETQVRIIYRTVLIGGIAAVFIVIFAGYFISRNITDPIVEMKQIALDISKGDFSRKASVKTNDELGELAASLNSMSDELQTKIEKLRELNTIRKDFVANVSHELKTPLTSIKGFIETLEDGALYEEQNAKRFLMIIKKHTERLEKIIADLLTLSELESSRYKLEVKMFDLGRLLNEILAGFQHTSEINHQHIKLKTDDGLEMYGDEYKIEQVIVNLIVNAIKYGKEHSEIVVNASKKSNEIILTIKDHGIGIPESQINRIFERFYRVDKARSSSLGGTGLGLSIVKHIINLHGGRLEVESMLGQGTTITIYLPTG